MAQPVLAERAATSAPVNQFSAPVLAQNSRINYQQAELQQQRAAFQPSVATHSDRTSQLLRNKHSKQALSAELQQVFESFSLGQGIGVNGLLHGDYNSDGVTELVLANPASIVFAAAKEGQFRLQQQLPFESGIGKLEYFRDLSTDGHFAFFSTDNKLQKLDLISRKVVASVDIDGITSYQLLSTTDLQTEVLLVTSYTGDLRLVNPHTLQVLRRQSGFDAEIAAIGAFTAANRLQVLFKKRPNL